MQVDLLTISVPSSRKQVQRLLVSVLREFAYYSSFQESEPIFSEDNCYIYVLGQLSIHWNLRNPFSCFCYLVISIQLSGGIMFFYYFAVM